MECVGFQLAPVALPAEIRTLLPAETNAVVSTRKCFLAGLLARFSVARHSTLPAALAMLTSIIALFLKAKDTI
jgi:hypothetical protein